MASLWITVFAILFVGLGCGAARDPLDPSSADKRLEYSGEERDRYGSPIAYEHGLRAEILLGRKDFERAVEEFDKALKADPADNYLRVRLARASMENGDPKKAERHIEKALKNTPADEYAWLGLAVYLKETGDNRGAEAAAKRAMRVEPDSADAAMWLAGFYGEAGEHKQGAEILARALEADPFNADAMLYLGEAYLALGDKSLAASRLEEFLKLRPMRSGEVAKLASSQIDGGDLSAGAELLTLAVRADPSNASLRLKLVEVLLDLRLPDRAVKHLDLLPAPEPDDFGGVASRVCLLVRAGRPYEARALLAMGLNLDADEKKESAAALARIEVLLGRIENAKLLFESAGDFESAKRIESKTSFTEPSFKGTNAFGTCEY